MGFMDEVGGGGGAKLLKFDGKAGNYVVRGSEGSFNNQEFVADVFGAKGGYLKFGGKDQPPERQLGSIFPQGRSSSAQHARQCGQERMAGREIR
jgi:hypothetical protein